MGTNGGDAFMKRFWLILAIVVMIVSATVGLDLRMDQKVAAEVQARKDADEMLKESLTDIKGLIGHNSNQLDDIMKYLRDHND